MKKASEIIFAVVSLALAVTAIGAGLHTSGGTETTAFEQFKGFLQNPPAIEHLIVQQTLPPPSLPIADARGASSRAMEHRYFEARWIPGTAVFYRELPALSALTNLAEGRGLVAYYGADHWLADGMQWIERWTDHADAPDRDNDVVRVSRFRLQPLWETLTFGVQHLEAGRIVWSGNRFAAHTPAVPGLEEFDISGELISGTNGLPAGMNLTYSWLGKKANWATKYRYEKLLEPAWLPSGIEQYWGGRLSGRYDILEIAVSKGPLSTSAFDPEPFIEASGWSIRVLTNNAAYTLQPSGELRFLESFDPRLKPGPGLLSHQAGLQSAYVLLGGFNLWLLVLAVRMKMPGPE